jgi:hypothetical protein
MATAATTTPSRVIVYRPPHLTDYQRAALFCPERYALIEATSKAGKTVGALAWLTELAMRSGKAGRNYWWVAPIYSQAKIAFRRLKRSLTRGAFMSNETELTITLANGAVLWFKGSENPDSLYGEDVFGAVIDEASRVKEESWHAVRSTLTATRGPLRIIGNVKGRQNWAYKLARKAEGGEPDMHYAKITAADAVKAGILDAAEIEDARSKLPDVIFRELYYAEPADDGGNPFGVAAIHACIAPMSIAPTVAFGLDLAKSTDWCVLLGLDAAGLTSYFDRWQGPWESTIIRVIAAVGNVRTLVDSTGAGDPVLEGLQKQGRAKGARFEGFTFSSASKQRLMEGLSVAIQSKRVRYPADAPPKRVIVSELEAFEYEYHRTGVSYGAAPGVHDDCVCALALAVQHLSRAAQTLTYTPGMLASGGRAGVTYEGNV